MIDSLRAVHHVGATVPDLDEALAFWVPFLGMEVRWRTVLAYPYLGRVTGYPGMEIDAAVIDLPGGCVLELLDYQLEDRGEPDPATTRPGNVHVCLLTSAIDEDWARAVSLGATPVSDGPVDVMDGPNKGARACYLRVPGGITLELFQPPQGA